MPSGRGKGGGQGIGGGRGMGRRRGAGRFHRRGGGRGGYDPTVRTDQVPGAGPAGNTPAPLRFNKQQPRVEQTPAKAGLNESKGHAEAERVIARVDESACVLCGACEAVCPAGAVKMDQTVALIDSEKCAGCGVCVDACPQGAIVLA